MNIFFDLEFTGLHRDTDAISVGLTAANGNTFYGIFNDFRQSQINDWLQKNVLDTLFNPISDRVEMNKDFNDVIILIGTGYATSQNTKITVFGDTYVTGNKEYIGKMMKEWLDQYGDIQFIGDCISYDWILMTKLLATYNNGYPEFPKNISYIPFDICTYMILKGVDPDISRESFINNKVKGRKHNSLYDSKVIKECYLKLNLLK